MVITSTITGPCNWPDRAATALLLAARADALWLLGGGRQRCPSACGRCRRPAVEVAAHEPHNFRRGIAEQRAIARDRPGDVGRGQTGGGRGTGIQHSLAELRSVSNQFA